MVVHLLMKEMPTLFLCISVLSASHVLFRYGSDGAAYNASTEKLLSEYLEGRQRTRSIALPVIHPRPTATIVASTVACPLPQIRCRQTFSPSHEATNFRSVSPVCRGLLEAGEIVSEPLDFDTTEASIKVPAPRSASPQGSTLSLSGAQPFRRHISRASPTLKSVKEEASSHLGS